MNGASLLIVILYLHQNPSFVLYSVKRPLILFSDYCTITQIHLIVKFHEGKEYVIASVPKRAGALLKASVQNITENHPREVKPNLQ